MASCAEAGATATARKPAGATARGRCCLRCGFDDQSVPRLYMQGRRWYGRHLEITQACSCARLFLGLSLPGAPVVVTTGRQIADKCKFARKEAPLRLPTQFGEAL